MPTKLSTTVSKIHTIPNATNATIIEEFHKYMKDNDASERHQNNALKVVIAYAKFLGSDNTLYDIKHKEQITSFLDTKIKPIEQDPDKKWITTWNHYLHRIKHLFRWLYNQRGKEEVMSQSEWVTPVFAKIKEKKTRRLSPYSETEIWDRDELLTIIKYEPYLRNKAALTLCWDMDARNHEVTMLKIKNIRLRERYGEGEIPHEAKTGSGPILLTCSFPYVRDWINRHPFKNSPEARLICNLHNGAPVRPEVLWTVIKQLHQRIVRLLESNSIDDTKEREKLEYLIKTKRWNPYCIRHSSITHDSDYLPDYALKKKVRWSMNSKQGSRYIKRRMGDDLKQNILVHDGIMTDTEVPKKLSVLSCPRCNLVNAVDNKYCSQCSYPLVPSAFEEIKAAEDAKIQTLQQKHEQDMKTMREEMKQQFSQIMSMIQQNPKLANIKQEALARKIEI
jgi:integrase/recombinase XerD